MRKLHKEEEFMSKIRTAVQQIRAESALPSALVHSTSPADNLNMSGLSVGAGGDGVVELNNTGQNASSSNNNNNVRGVHDS